MKAVYLTETGGPEVLRYDDLPLPTPGEHQVQVKVAAVAVNPVDTYIRSGKSYGQLPMPFVIGADMAGTVQAVGRSVTDLAVGQRVWGTNQQFGGRQGVFAEICCVDREWLYELPAGVPFEAAAACALVGVTAHLGLFREVGLTAGETVFVQGGAGGVGSMVVQMAKAAGAKVIASAGDGDKLALCRELGADEVVNYRADDVAAKVKAFAPKGVDVYWEIRREPDFAAIVPLMAQRGRIVLMAGGDASVPFPVRAFFANELSLHGFVMFKATPEEMRVAGEEIGRWLASGELRPVIGRRMMLSQAAEAHRLQEAATLEGSEDLHGKIVLAPDGA